MVKPDWIEFSGRMLRAVGLREAGLRMCDRMLGGPEVPVNSERVGRIVAALSEFHPDEGSSCMMDNTIAPPEYDIQVIMPVYNTAATVCAAVDSVLGQAGDVKVLLSIVNDGSPDNSRELLRRYEGMPGVEIIDQTNRGFSGARNAGLRCIKARYVTFLDSDDRLAPGALRALLDKADACDADVVQGAFSMVTPDGKVHGSWVPEELDREGMTTGFPWGKLYRAELFGKVGFPERYWYEDTLMSMIIFPQAQLIASTSAMVYEYLINPKGITSTAKRSPKVMDSLWVLMRLLDDRERLGLRPTVADYERFLLQTRNNHRRVFRVGGNTVARLIFEMHRYIRERYFADPEVRKVRTPWHERAERALATGSYRAFRMWVGLR